MKKEKKRLTTSSVASLFYFLNYPYLFIIFGLRPNSFTFGNVSELSFRSLNHDFLTVLDDDAAVVAANGLSHDVIHL